MRPRPPRPVERATEREVGVVAAALIAGSEKTAAHRPGRSHSTVTHYLAKSATMGRTLVTLHGPADGQ